MAAVPRVEGVVLFYHTGSAKPLALQLIRCLISMVSDVGPNVSE